MDVLALMIGRIPLAIFWCHGKKKRSRSFEISQYFELIVSHSFFLILDILFSANSLAITEEVATDFPEGLKYCVGAANSPFANEKAKSIFSKRGVMHIPESISSAGAILADSVEVSLQFYYLFLR